MIRQDSRLPAKVSLQVGPWVGLVGDGELVVAGGNWRQIRDRVPAGESAPWCSWSPRGRAVAAPVQHNLLEVGTLENQLSCGRDAQIEPRFK